MRIISGEHRGRRIQAPKNQKTRPTPDRVREALFSSLEVWLGGPGSLVGVRVLDLYAGSGALGIEALSRGAGHVVFVERDPAAIDVFQANLELLALTGSSEVHKGQVLRVLSSSRLIEMSFDVALIDPPFESAESANILQGLLDANRIRLGGIVILEHRAGSDTPRTEGFENLRTRNYGKVATTFYRRVDTAQEIESQSTEEIE